MECIATRSKDDQNRCHPVRLPGIYKLFPSVFRTQWFWKISILPSKMGMFFTREDVYWQLKSYIVSSDIVFLFKHNPLIHFNNCKFVTCTGTERDTHMCLAQFKTMYPGTLFDIILQILLPAVILECIEDARRNYTHMPMNDYYCSDGYYSNFTKIEHYRCVAKMAKVLCAI